jgi:hypothetical protein
MIDVDRALHLFLVKEFLREDIAKSCPDTSDLLCAHRFSVFGNHGRTHRCQGEYICYVVEIRRYLAVEIFLGLFDVVSSQHEGYVFFPNRCRHVAGKVTRQRVGVVGLGGFGARRP